MEEVLNLDFKKVQSMGCYPERIFSWREQQKREDRNDATCMWGELSVEDTAMIKWSNNVFLDTGED